MKCLPPWFSAGAIFMHHNNIELSWYWQMTKKHPTCTNMKKVCAFLTFPSVDSWQYAVALTIFLGGHCSNKASTGVFWVSQAWYPIFWLASMKAQVLLNLLKIFPESTFHPPKSRNKRMTFWTCQRCYWQMKLPQTWNISQEQKHFKRKGLCIFLE